MNSFRRALRLVLSRKAVFCFYPVLIFINYCPHGAASDTVAKLKVAKSLIEDEDYLGFRVLIQKLKSVTLTGAQWLFIQNIIIRNTDYLGYDLAHYWNNRMPLVRSGLDDKLEKADVWMAEEKFDLAFKLYQETASDIKRALGQSRRSGSSSQSLIQTTLERLYTHVLHSMARALYGANRLKEALIVYQWFGPHYSGFRQILFEKMWTAFKLGKVDIAIGAIASQHSIYFSEHLSPEAYLIETYLFRKLCRVDDLKEVVEEMRAWEKLLTKGGGMESWARADPITLSLWKLSSQRTDLQSPFVSRAERETERKRIDSKLGIFFEGQRKKILAELKSATAYIFLAEGKASHSLLEAVSSLPSRSAYFKLNLEIWPVLDQEEWVDEVGYRRFFGESLCKISPVR